MTHKARSAVFVARRSHRPPALQRWLLTAPLLLGAACGGPQALGAAGTTCFRDDDCEAGLICVAPMDDELNRVCSNDPTPLISNVEGPPVVEPMGGAGGMGGVMPMAGGGMVAMAGGGAANAGSPAAGAGAGGGGTGGNGGTDAAGTGGAAAGTAGSGGSDPEGGAAN